MISIIIPTYNERQNAPFLIQTIMKVCQGSSFKLQIIIVDDDSPDGTGIYMKEKYKKNKNVNIYIRKKERGLASAILFGIKKAKGQIIVGIDADFNHPPELIPHLIRQLKIYDLVIGSRFIKGGGMEEKGRYVGTYLFNWFLRNVLGFPVTDNMSGFYAIKRKILLKLNITDIYRGYGDYHLRLVWYAMKSKIRIGEVPVYYKTRIYGKSKSHLLRMFFSYLIYAFQLRLKNISSSSV